MNKCPECRMLVQDGIATCPSCGQVIPGVRVVERTTSAFRRPRRHPRSAIAGFALCVTPLFLTNIIGLVLSAVALKSIYDNPVRFKGKLLLIVGMLFAVLLLALQFVVVYKVSDANLFRFFGNKKQQEARQTLQELLQRQQQFRTVNGRYASTFAELGMLPHPQARYAFFLAEDVMSTTTPPRLQQSSYASDTGFQAVASGNIDSDDDLDVWLVNERGELLNVSNDLD